MTVDQIDQILNSQEDGRTWRRFGEIAVERGQLDGACLVVGLSEFWELQRAGTRSVGSRFGFAQDA